MSIRTNSNWFKLWIEEAWKFKRKFQWRGRWTRRREQQWSGPNIQLLFKCGEISKRGEAWEKGKPRATKSVKSRPNRALNFYPSRAALRRVYRSYSRCLSHKDDGNRQKGCIVDKLVKFMGICYLNQFTFHGFINIQVRASEINIKVTE